MGKSEKDLETFAFAKYVRSMFMAIVPPEFKKFTGWDAIIVDTIEEVMKKHERLVRGIMSEAYYRRIQEVRFNMIEKGLMDVVVSPEGEMMLIMTPKGTEAANRGDAAINRDKGNQENLDG